MTRSDLTSAVTALPWFHSIDLGGGVITPGRKAPEVLQAEASVVFKYFQPGWTVLDVGAWDGFFSFEAKRRGASRVLATDEFSWIGGGWGKKASFDLAKESLGLDIDEMIIDPMNMTSETVAGDFDCCLFLGVLYHLRHPLWVLERIAPLARRMLIVETQIDMTEVGRPAMAFYPGRELGDDPTNWWAPNVPAAIALLKTAGFETVKYTDHPVYPGSRGFFHAIR